MKLIFTILALIISATLLTMPSASQATKYWQEKADQLYNSGSYKDAAAAYNKAIELDPSDAVLWYNHGLVLSYGLKDYQNAIKSFDKALELNSSFFEALVNR
jgi:tetratricopeptide (TPR) repeat protein